MGKQVNNVSSSSSSGIGFFGALALVFIVLKLIGTITWSWVWVLSPLWLGTALVLLIIGLIFLVAIISVFRDDKKSKMRRRK